jgi:spore maturation protein CgeB
VIPFNLFARAISAARVNLNVTRRPHATVTGSSTARPFELASSGAAIVSNPHEGIERWFEPGRELLIVNSTEEAVAAYRELVSDPGQAEAMGQRARERVLDEHTYAHRARRLLELVGLEAGVAA